MKAVNFSLPLTELSEPDQKYRNPFRRCYEIMSSICKKYFTPNCHETRIERNTRFKFAFAEREGKKMELTDQRTERRRFKRHKVNRRPIAVLGPDPVRVGHVTVISDEAAEIQFTENNRKAANRFSELVVLVPDFNNPFLSEKIHVETVSCNSAPDVGNRAQSQLQKCVISLDNLNFIRKRQLKSACL